MFPISNAIAVESCREDVDERRKRERKRGIQSVTSFSAKKTKICSTIGDGRTCGAGGAGSTSTRVLRATERQSRAGLNALLKSSFPSFQGENDTSAKSCSSLDSETTPHEAGEARLDTLWAQTLERCYLTRPSPSLLPLFRSFPLHTARTHVWLSYRFPSIANRLR
jgi:hypothetical protein